MSDLTDAIEALAAELWSDANPDMPIRDCDAWQECIGLARRALNRATPVIEAAARADERAKVAEEIQAARRTGITALLEGGWNHAIETAAAIARQEGNRA